MSDGLTLRPGFEVRAFDPRTFGVVKYGRVLSVGRTYARVDFGVTGAARVRIADVLEVTDTRPRGETLRADLAAGADVAGGSEMLAARVLAAAANVR